MRQMIPLRMMLLVAAIGTLVLWSCSQPAVTPPLPSGVVDLLPGVITPSSSSVLQGASGSLTVNLNVDNIGGATAPANDFSVDFYLATSNAFSPSTDQSLGSSGPISSSIAGNSSTPVSATFSLPTLSSSEAVYIYADVVAVGTTVDSNTANNVSTAANAAIVLAYQSATSNTYNLNIDTYSPNGGASFTTGLALYVDSGSGNMTLVDYNFPAVGSGTFATLSETGLAGASPGTKYYLAVLNFTSSGGSYVLDVYSPNLSGSLPSFTPVGPPDTNTSSNTPTILNNPPSSPKTAPTTPQALTVGNAENLYIDAGNVDWFTFTLP